MPVTAVDDLKSYAPSRESSGTIELVTPSDSDELTHVSKAFLIGVDGALCAVDEFGVEKTIPSGYFAVGIFHPGRWKKIKSAGTTADKILYQW